MSDTSPTLSLCLIVRNAEKPLAAALASARPFADEIIVVDTGSTDRTRGVAREFGARLCDFAWCDDFSAARNHSLQQASGDWIFWMDADDVLPEASGRELRRLVAECRERDAAFWAVVEEEARDRRGYTRVMGHAHVKLFPRHEKIRFRYRIHEQVAPAIQALDLPIRPSTVTIRHAHADRSAAGERARSDRNLRLALLDLAERPDDPFVWISVGTAQLFRADGLAEATHYLERAVRGFPSGSQNQLNAFLYWGQALGTGNQREQEERVYREALVLFPNDFILLRRLAHLCERAGRLQEAAQCLQTALQRGRMRRAAVHNREGTAKVVLQLGALYVRLGERGRAERLWDNYLRKHPDATAVQTALHQSYLQSCSYVIGTKSYDPSRRT